MRRCLTIPASVVAREHAQLREPTRQGDFGDTPAGVRCTEELFPGFLQAQLFEESHRRRGSVVPETVKQRPGTCPRHTQDVVYGDRVGEMLLDEGLNPANVIWG